MKEQHRIVLRTSKAKLGRAQGVDEFWPEQTSFEASLPSVSIY